MDDVSAITVGKDDCQHCRPQHCGRNEELAAMPPLPSNPRSQPSRRADEPLRQSPWRSLLWNLPLALLLLWMWQDAFYHLTVHTIPYSEFREHVARGDVIECDVRETEIIGRIRGIPRDAQPASQAAAPDQTPAPTPAQSPAPAPDQQPAPELPAARAAQPPSKDTAAEEQSVYQFRTVRVEDPQLIEALQAAGVRYTGVRPGFLTSLLTAWILPLGIMLLLWIFLARRLGAAGQAMMSVGRSRARLISEKSTGVTFADVAGCDEAKYELQEVVDFLKHPDRYTALGAKIPRGVLLLGPPGTGKTLIAKAVAGEAQTPFFSLSGSEFVELFVGVGASRVRDLFDQAKAQAPCIVFIDELDAIGRERGVHLGVVNDEREQTLNQLLVELDGFDPNAGVILLAATNRPEVLDRALLRPGRFDRQIILDAPDLNGREAILKVHARNKPMADDVELRHIAQTTPGFSGADLANTLNEAALLAARRNATRITQQDIEAAVEKVVAGPERRSRRLNDAQRRRVAYHEVGHALVGTYCQHADPIQKISIVPRGHAALGYTLQLPTDDQLLLTRTELLDRLKGLLGGRAAEECVFQDVSTGAENDLERATTLARQMVCLYGMDDQVGLMHCARREGIFLQPQDTGLQVDCSPRTAEMIDQQVRKLLDAASAAARQILQEHRAQLEHVTQELLKCETLDGPTFRRLLTEAPPQASPAGS